ncbi:DEAD/DEAH box helicase [Mycolicibacterium sp.]|uniref:DEAD/DEAH box helicase n=1 Tax=Mycolicibacterium sp. TaxID=2320850 RepID=UPI001A3264F2|nr:DEAD/DEAH box helicase [Mycolicibacterium sp.]MBJ7340631.1 DEAD/DEAH box helicase [Mycolicibacterium sp.]
MASSYENLVARLRAPQIDDEFDLLAEIAAYTTQTAEARSSTDLVIRAFDRLAEFTHHRDILWSLARQHGLFPYLQSDIADLDSGAQLPFPDLVALEMHRPDAMNDVVFHRVQAQIYQRLRNRENVILSAPTSFGKSLIIDSLISTDDYSNIVIIVPTIALIDETRRRLSKFEQYKVITHPGQSFEVKNLFVVTQERFLALEQLPIIDLFFIDEFYKLAEVDGRRNQLSTRASLLNQALRRLLATGAQYYMAGPSISSIDGLLPPDVRAAFFRTDYATVAADTIRLRPKNDDQRRQFLLEILADSDDPTLVYCQSPQRARKILSWIMEEPPSPNKTPGLPQAANWLRSNYHPEWSLPAALERGVGLHHGRLPRWLSQLMVESFNDGSLNTLICTNSLIEGVNTRAKRVIIVDRNIANRAYDYFTFSNIRGRAGRMFKHFVGTVYLFHDSPPAVLPDVDFPGLTQSDLAPDSLLITVDAHDRTDQSNERLADVLEQDLVSESTLRENLGVDPTAQVSLAKYLGGLSDSALLALSWSTPYPTYDAVGRIIELIWEYLPPPGVTAHGATSPRQLTYYVGRTAAVDGVTKLLIQEFAGGDREFWRANETLDDRIELAFDFSRFWLSHNLPALIIAVDRITREIQLRRGLDPCNFAPYAGRVESGFMRPLLLSLEEYGVPAEVSLRVLPPQSNHEESLDTVLETLAEVSVSDHPDLHPFEVDLIRRFQSSV